MVKKEASKGREWEKGRRDVLNQTFSELHKALPTYVEGQNISKKTILTQALSCILQLREEQKTEISQGNELIKPTGIQKWVFHILTKFYQLLAFLESINVRVPPNLMSVETPPECESSDVLNLLTKIRKFNAEDLSDDQVAVLKRKLKTSKKEKAEIVSTTVSAPTNVPVQSVCSNNVITIPAGKSPSSENLNSDLKTTLIASSSVIRSSPLVVQSSSLQVPSQLLFTSNTPTSPMSTSVPLLVSVTGVKTVNPFIFVQSNVVTPTPLASQKFGSTLDRPIQPGPPSKSTSKCKKVPIPSLKQKAILSKILPLGHSQKLLKREPNGKALKVLLNSGCEQLVRGKNVAKVKTMKTTLTTGTKAGVNLHECPNLNVAENQAVSQVSDSRNIQVTTDIDKENVAQRNNINDLESIESQGHNFPYSSSKQTTVSNDMSCKSDVEKESSSTANLDQVCAIEKLRGNDDDGSKKTVVSEIDNSAAKRLCEVDINTDNVKRTRSDAERCDEGRRKSDDASGNFEEASPVKLSKSNYSISALCERQQYMHGSGMASQVSGPGNMQEAVTGENRTDLDGSRSTSSGDLTEAAISRSATVVKSNDDTCTLEKGKEVSSSSIDSYTEWPMKSKCKMDRVCSSYVFTSPPVHNSKNTFIPISDIDGFKSVSEPFDAADNSFGLPLPSSDISNDIFASLHVPAGGQHSESISPTAAFLLAFPLVSTSKATELLSDDGVCENNDSQPGMKTILQIGNLDCDTPITKCVNVFSSIENSNVIYSTSTVFSQDTMSVTHTKNKVVESSDNNGNFIQKDQTEITSRKSNDSGQILTLKESSNFSSKNSLSSKENEACPSKAHYQSLCVNSNKEDNEGRHLNPQNHQIMQTDNSLLQSKPTTEVSSNVLLKSPQKLSNTSESTSFILCEKQTEWIEMSQTPQAVFPDFPPSSSSRSDCAVNYALPPALMTSSSIPDELLSVSKSQASLSSAGILSWSTLSSTDIVQPSKVVPKTLLFQDTCSVPKSANKSQDVQQILSSHRVNSSAIGQSHMASGSVTMDKSSSLSQHYNQTEPLISSSSHEPLLNGKHNPASTNFSSRNNADAKKVFPAQLDSKLLQCGASEAVKISSDLLGTGHFSHQQQPTLCTPSSSSTSLLYSVTSESKQSKVNNAFFDERALSQDVKSGLNSNVGSVSSKQSVNQINYRQNSIAPEENQTSSSSTYVNLSHHNGKEGLDQTNEMVNVYQHQNNMTKNQVISNNQFAMGSVGFHDLKKNAAHFDSNHGALMDIPKQNLSGLNYISENATGMMQYGSSSVAPLPVGEEHYISNKTNGLERQQEKAQSNQQRQQCVRSNNKEPTTNLHRPPVNWMTAPDIRSHQHHSGPSFGNNSTVNGGQGFLYLSEHPKDPENNSTVFDQTSNFHCLDLPHAGQSFYKGNELHLFGNENVENFHDNSAWSPSKSGSSSMLGNIMIPSTLPTLVGDLALGDNNLCRPFLPSYNNDPPSCPKKTSKRNVNSARRAEKIEEDNSAVPGSGQECAGSFLSVSQLVNTGSGSKGRPVSSKENAVSYIGSFGENDPTCLKQNTSKLASSNYSTEALLSSSNGQQMNQVNHRKRRSHGSQYASSHIGSGMPYQNSGNLQVQGSQSQFLAELPRTNDFQGAFLHSDSVSSFMLGSPSRTHRNHTYALQNVAERPSVEDNTSSQRAQHVTIAPDITSTRPRTTINSSVNNSISSSPATVSSSNSIMDFGYMNMSTAVLQDDINFPNPPPHTSFLSHHHSYPMSTQDAHFSTPRLPIHPTHAPQSSNIQSPSATTLTNFHLSTIFPEINEKVIC